MNCPKCGSIEARIARTIMGPIHDIRQRRCRCGVCWQTIEKIVPGTVQVKLAGEIVPGAQVKMVATQNSAQVQKGDKGGSDPVFSSSFPVNSDPNPKASLLSEPRARVGRKGRPSTQGYTAEFESFWSRISVRRGNKLPAFQAWVKMDPSISHDLIFTRYEQWAATPQWQDGFSLHVATWLNQKGWESEPSEADMRPRGKGAKSDGNVETIRDWMSRSAG